MPINKGILKEIECQFPVLKVLGLNPNGITLQNPQDSEYQFLADFSVCAMHHICTTNYLLLSNVHGLLTLLYQGV